MAFRLLQSAICAILANSGEGHDFWTCSGLSRPEFWNLGVSVWHLSSIWYHSSLHAICKLMAAVAHTDTATFLPRPKIWTKFSSKFRSGHVMVEGCHYIHSPGLLLGVLVKGNRARAVILQGGRAWVPLKPNGANTSKWQKKIYKFQTLQQMCRVFKHGAFCLSVFYFRPFFLS